MIPATILSEGLAGSPSYPARPMPCTLEALRAIVCDAIMTTLGGARATTYSYNSPSARRTGFYHGSSSHGAHATGLRPVASPRCYAAIIDAPLLGKRARGWGFAGRLQPFLVLLAGPLQGVTGPVAVVVLQHRTMQPSLCVRAQAADLGSPGPIGVGLCFPSVV
jgi:hypothetical protein